MFEALAAAFGLGLVSGLRTFTGHLALVIVSVLGWIPNNSMPEFTTWTSTRVIVALLAVGEYAGDKLPSAPNRTAFAGLAARLVLGATCGYYVSALTGAAWWLCSFVGAAGGATGAFGGLKARIWLSDRFPEHRFLIALTEDAFALGSGLLIWVAIA